MSIGGRDVHCRFLQDSVSINKTTSTPARAIAAALTGVTISDWRIKKPGVPTPVIPRATEGRLPDATGPWLFAGMMPARYESLQRRV